MYQIRSRITNQSENDMKRWDNSPSSTEQEENEVNLIVCLPGLRFGGEFL